MHSPGLFFHPALCFSVCIDFSANPFDDKDLTCCVSTGVSRRTAQLSHLCVFGHYAAASTKPDGEFHMALVLIAVLQKKKRKKAITVNVNEAGFEGGSCFAAPALAQFVLRGNKM